LYFMYFLMHLTQYVSSSKKLSLTLKGLDTVTVFFPCICMYSAMSQYRIQFFLPKFHVFNKCKPMKSSLEATFSAMHFVSSTLHFVFSNHSILN
jgi:hypothetical protein